MSYGWENHEPAPLEYFHGRIMDLFHEMRRDRVGQENINVSINGSDLGNLIASAKRQTYQKYPKQVSPDAIPKSEM